MSRRGIIDFIERNIRGACVVWGALGIRQYYNYTKAEAERMYRDEYARTDGFFVCRAK